MWHGKFDPSIPMATGAWCPPYVVPCYGDAGARYTPYGIPSCGGGDSARNFLFDAEHVRYCGQQQQLPTPNYSAPVQLQQPTYMPMSGNGVVLAVDVSITASSDAAQVTNLTPCSLCPQGVQQSEEEANTHQVFGEMPTPSSWHGTDVIAPGHWNYGYVHQTPIQSSRVQDGNTNIGEHYLEEMPPHYGFQNLNRQSVLLIDGTEHSYYVLPENYSFEHATSSTYPAMPTVEVRSSCQSFTPPMNCTVAEKQTQPAQETLSILDMLAQVKDKLETIIENYEKTKHSCERTLFCTKEKGAAVNNLPSQDPHEKEQLAKYDDETDGSSHELVDMFATTLDKQPNEEEQQASDHLLKCVGNATELKQTSACLTTTSDVQVFSFELQQQHDERAYNCSDVKAPNSVVTRSNQNSIEHSMRELRLLWNPGASHAHVLPGDTSIKLTNEKSIQALPILFLQEPTLNCADERSQLKFKKQDMLINKHNITSSCDLNHDKEVPFVLHYQLPLSSTPCIWDPGIDLFSYKKMHLVSWIPHSTILLLQQLHNKIISSMWQFSLEKGRKLQWDPGIELLLYDLLWLKTLSKGTEYAMRQLLAVKFGIQNSTYFIDTAASLCCSPTYLIQQGRNVATVLHFWRSIFKDMHYCQISQKCNAINSLFHWHQYIKFNGIALWLITFNPP